MKHLAGLFLLLLSATCAYTQETVKYCDLVRNPDKYNGKEVTVRATLSIAFEWQLFYCLECTDLGKAWLELPIDLDDDRGSRHAVKKIPAAGVVNLTVTGIFHKGGGGHPAEYVFTPTRIRDVVVLVKGYKNGKREKEIEARCACGGTQPK